MTEQEYRAAMQEIERRAADEKRTLGMAFAIEHSPVKVGDYVTDHLDTIRVEGWAMSRRSHDWNALPCLVYRGTTCKRDGTPRKNPKPCDIYQSNLLYVNGKFIKNHGYEQD